MLLYCRDSKQPSRNLYSGEAIMRWKLIVVLCYYQRMRCVAKRWNLVETSFEASPYATTTCERTLANWIRYVFWRHLHTFSTWCLGYAKKIYSNKSISLHWVRSQQKILHLKLYIEISRKTNLINYIEKCHSQIRINGNYAGMHVINTGSVWIQMHRNIQQPAVKRPHQHVNNYGNYSRIHARHSGPNISIENAPTINSKRKCNRAMIQWIKNKIASQFWVFSSMPFGNKFISNL